MRNNSLSEMGNRISQVEVGVARVSPGKSVHSAGTRFMADRLQFSFPLAAAPAIASGFQEPQTISGSFVVRPISSRAELDGALSYEASSGRVPSCACAPWFSDAHNQPFR